MTLEHAYFWSQIALTGIAAVAAVGAYVQLQTFKRFELLKMLEDADTRKARRTVHRRVQASDPAPWWEDEELEAAAAKVCSSFDIVGVVAPRGMNRRLFAKHWGHGICWTYERLHHFLEDRRKNDPHAYEEFHALYERAKKLKGTSP